jgi:FkbM family methyltransferase
MPVELVMELAMQSPPPLWPAGFQEFSNVIAAHTELMRRHVASCPPFPAESYTGRGIVICAGGEKFFPSTYTTVRSIRHYGCVLPIELWYYGDLGEYSDDRAGIMADFGPIRWVDANEVAREKGLQPRYLGNPDGLAPWEIKAFAILHSAFEEVLSLDADSAPLQDPTWLFDAPKYRETSALLWPDGMPLPPQDTWRRFGLKHVSGTAVESGQMLINKRAAWKAVNLAWWLNEHRDYFYRVPGFYGDKDLFHLAFLFTGTPFVFPWHEPERSFSTYLQKDFKGRDLFQHRTHRKLTLPGGDGRFQSGYFAHEDNVVRKLKNDRLLKDWIKELDELVNYNAPDRRHFRIRPDTADDAMWRECVIHNAYRLPRAFEPGTIVLDLGANIGAFTHAALRRGAAFVYGVEPEPENIRTLQRNLQRHRDKVKLFYAACWRSDAGPIRYVNLAGLKQCEHWTIPTANWTVEDVDYEGDRTQGAIVRAFRFDALVRRIVKRHPGAPLVLKIDIEGGEWAVMSTSQELHRFNGIYGEWHRATWDGMEWGPDDAREILERAGLGVEVEDGEKCGYFRAYRDLQAAG